MLTAAELADQIKSLLDTGTEDHDTLDQIESLIQPLVGGFDYEATFGIRPDTVPDLTGNGPYCEALHPDGPACTRRPGHKGRHAAGNEEFIVAVWS
jgi:hypothetical protein